MEVTCQECGAKNPMGAIFCRECGAKLDMNAVQPKVKNKSTDGGFKLTKLAVRRLISLAITIALFGFLALLVMDDAPTLPDAPGSTKEVGIVKAVYRIISSGKGKGKTMPPMSGRAVTHYFSTQLAEMQEGQEGGMIFKDAIFEFYDENHIKMDLRVEIDVVGMKKNLSMQMILTFENEGDGVIFNVESAKHGKIPLPALKDKLVYSRFARLVPEGDDLEKMLDSVKELIITEDGKLAIKLK